MATLQEQIDALFTANESLDARATAGTMTTEEETSFRTNNGEIRRLQGLQTEQAESRRLRAETETRLMQATNDLAQGEQAVQGTQVVTTRGTSVVTPRRLSEHQMRAFKKGTPEERAKRAYGAGQWFMAVLGGSERALKYCRENGLELRAQLEGQNEKGGYLVPEEFGTDMIDLRNEYGVFRRNARVVNMISDTKTVPRRTGGLTVYYPGEAGTITESTKGWDRVGLVARKAAVLAKYSSELGEDAVLDIANDLMEEISYAFTVAEDLNGFIGDGTSAYAGIVGVCNKILNLSATRANIAGLQVGTGNQWSELLLADFNYTKAKLPLYARRRGVPKWYMSQEFYYGVAERLMLAVGGVTAAEVAAGRDQPVFMGSPVEVTEAMPTVEANDKICALYGVLPLAAIFGDRRQDTIATSEHLNFAEDEIAIRGTERYDIVVHDVGNASATASLRVAGPIVALVTAAS